MAGTTAHTWARPRLSCRSPPAGPELALEPRPEPWARRGRSRRGGEHTHHDRHRQPDHLGEPPDRPKCIIRAIAGPTYRGREGAGCCRLPGMCAESSAVSSLGVDQRGSGTLSRAWHRTCVSLDGGGYVDDTEHHAPRSRRCGRRARPLGGRGDRHHRLHGEPRPRAALRNLQRGALRRATAGTLVSQRETLGRELFTVTFDSGQKLILFAHEIEPVSDELAA